MVLHRLALAALLATIFTAAHAGDYKLGSIEIIQPWTRATPPTAESLLPIPGITLPTPYGGKGMGRVTFNAEGRMAAVVVDGRPELPAGTARDYSSYCGNYTFDGSETGHDVADFLLGAPASYIQAALQVLDSRTKYGAALAPRVSESRALYLSASIRRNSRVIALIWTRYVATS